MREEDLELSDDEELITAQKVGISLPNHKGINKPLLGT